MLLKLITVYSLVSLVSICCLMTNCRQKDSELSKTKTVNAESVLKLPSEGSPMASPPYWTISPYDNLEESAVTSEWDVSSVDACISQDLMPSDRRKPSWINVTLRIKNKQRRSRSFTWETLIYEGWTQKEFPINLSTATNPRQQKTSFTVKAGSIKKLTLFTKEGPPFIETPNYSVRFRLVIQVTDEAKQSVQIRRSKVQFSISQ